MRHITAAAAATAFVALGAALLPAQAARADCAGPEVTVAPTTAEPGGTVTVTGRYFMATCNDTSVNGEDPPRAEPADVRISFAQDGRSSTLAKVTASTEYRIDERVTIPTWATPGVATVDASAARPVRITIASPGTAPNAEPPTLATTGADNSVALTALAGLTLVGAGALVVRRARRPSTR